MTVDVPSTFTYDLQCREADEKAHAAFKPPRWPMPRERRIWKQAFQHLRLARYIRWRRSVNTTHWLFTVMNCRDAKILRLVAFTNHKPSYNRC